MGDFGERLREERLRLGLNQEAFGELAGVSKNAQLSYEKDQRSPDASYLMTLMARGVDVHYLLTGVHQADVAAGLTGDEGKLLQLFRQTDAVRRGTALVVLDALSRASQ